MARADFYQPLPLLRAELGLVARYTRAQADQIRLGFAPESMDDRWALRFDPAENTLRMHRSWSGFCIFVVVFQTGGDGLAGGFEVAQSWVNRDRDQYRGTDVLADRQTAERLTERLLLGRKPASPV